MLSRDARLMLGLSLLAVPTVVWGGLTVLAVLTEGAAGAPVAPRDLSPLQIALYRAGHAHAGVLLVLSLVLQVALDAAALSHGLAWSARIAAPLAAVLVSGGFFGLAHLPALRALLYAGALLVVWATLVTGVGLLRARAGAPHRRT